MKVILLQELRGKGGEGDVVDVATGYAVNYLFPKKIAIEASKGNLKQLELRRHNIAKRESSRLDTADKMLAALEGKLVMIAAKVGEEGQLFGSVTTSQIAEALSVLHKIDVDRKSIDLKGPIKA
ncbi:MAG: 50S ribosomal protein L9, partial [Coriobacteriales bacterium]|nr:50S ribosomal protein L9 [Coriobacteriales bacterium]